MLGAVFEFAAGSLAGKRLKVSRIPFLIGRGENCHLRIQSEQVSRRHCKLSANPDGSVVVVDCGSRNGTYVNGRRISDPTTLKIGDRVRVGKLELELARRFLPDSSVAMSDDPEASAEPPTAASDPNRMTLDELVQFDDEPIALETEGEPSREVLPDTETKAADPQPPTAAAPKSETAATQEAAKQALKQIFRGR